MRDDKMKMCAVRLPPSVWNKLEVIAEQEYANVSIVIRRAIAQFLEKQPNQADNGKRQDGNTHQ